MTLNDIVKPKIIETIKNSVTEADTTALKYTSMTLEFPEGIEMEDIVSKAGVIASNRFFGGESYGYIITFKEAVTSSDLGAVLITHEVHGYNYFDGGRVSRSRDHILKIIKEGSKLKINPFLCKLCENGFIDDSEYYRMHLNRIDENGRLHLKVTYRTDFVRKMASANAGVVLSDPPKEVMRGTGFRDVEEVYSLK